MDTVTEWAGSLCCVCVLCAILSMISPAGQKNKNVEMIISLLVLVVAFRPIIALRDLAPKLKSYTVSPQENETLEEEVLSNAGSVYSSYLRENLERVLNVAGIKYKSVYVRMDKNEDGCISIGQVEVIVKNEDVNQADRIKRLLRDYIGFEPTVSVYREKGSESSG